MRPGSSAEVKPESTPCWSRLLESNTWLYSSTKWTIQQLTGMRIGMSHFIIAHSFLLYSIRPSLFVFGKIQAQFVVNKIDDRTAKYEDWYNTGLRFSKQDYYSFFLLAEFSLHNCCIAFLNLVNLDQGHLISSHY